MNITATRKGIDIPGTQYGAFVEIDGEVTDEKLAKAKEIVVERVCKMIREIANESEDFFIIKPTMVGDAITVGHKFHLPTVKEDRISGLIKE